MSKIIENSALQEYKDGMSTYGIYVSRKRVLANVKDGLKNIHRRILYAAYEDEKAITHNVKSAAIVGTTMKKMHPHGDSSIYDAMKPMTNWFEIMEPLLTGKGNWGNFQGDTAAASRYTESRVSQFTVECVIGELKESKEVVDWAETYDARSMEPEYLPVTLPLLLVNGTYGIGVGLSASVPKHNLAEVVDATLQLIKNPNSEINLIPDQCMVCDIIETNFKAIANKGNGSFKVRGIIEIGEYERKPALFIRSTPDMVYLNSVTESIEKLINDKKLIQIEDVVDDSSDDEMKYVIILKRGSDPNFVRDVIYKSTDMEKNQRVNFEVLDGINPLRMSYKSYILSFIEFRKITKFRLYCNKLQQVQTRLHERDAYIKVLQSGEIDNIINMIKSQSKIDDNYLIEYLINKLNITDLQAAFILKSNIRNLSIGYLNKYIEEANQLEILKNEYLNKITNDNLIIEEIISELKYIKKKYGRPRNCKVISESELSNIPKGEFKIIVTENNFIKKVQLNDNIGKFKGDTPKIVLKGENTENIIIFDEQGKCFKLPIHRIPFTDRNSNGTDIRTIIKNLTSNINKVIYEPVLKELSNKVRKYFVVTLSTGGSIKKMDIEDFLAVPPSGILFMKLDDNDYIKDISLIAEDLDIIVYSKNKALRMSLSEVPHQKRNTKGMRAISDDSVDGLSIIKYNTTDIIVITEAGKVNRFDVVALPNLGRNKTGSKIIKLSKGDSIRFVGGLNNQDKFRIVTRNERYEFNVSDIQPGSSVSSGNKLIPLKGDNIIRCDIIK